VSLAGGDADLLEITEEAFDNIYRINLRGTVFACKHAVAIMREQRSGAIVNVSSAAAVGKYPYVAYKATKAGVVAFTQQLALQNAPFGLRVNCILPGLISTPMAVDTRARTWKQTREQVLAERIAKVPLGREGTGWDVANAALFLASDEANFVTGVSLLVDGGRVLNIV
jgi:NAD(P)-dependent dehydrogenase (short-subunit alcohol dehydrogenase family)